MVTQGWVDVRIDLPPFRETVWLVSGDSHVWLGCRVRGEDHGWHWAVSNGVIYSDGGKIVSECDGDDVDVAYWGSLPLLPPKTTA